MTGQPVNALQKPGVLADYSVLKIALAFSDRKILHKRIEKRFEWMLESGLIDEVQSLLDDKYDRNSPAFKMIGYRQAIEFLEGVLSFEELREKG